ncbi:hypothetical protein NL676_034025 [Syzygium grande]|nr:hypothetical protein NL676_034025 [Syzygium grande]
MWNNGASCRRQYLGRCISASDSGTCICSQTIQVQIVDFALSSTLVAAADDLAITPSAVIERTMVAPLVEGREDEGSARLTIRTWIVWLGMQVPETEVLLHRTGYWLSHHAPLFHIPSPAAAKRLLDGNCAGSLLKHTDAETQ